MVGAAIGAPFDDEGESYSDLPPFLQRLVPECRRRMRERDFEALMKRIREEIASSDTGAWEREMTEYRMMQEMVGAMLRAYLDR